MIVWLGPVLRDSGFVTRRGYRAFLAVLPASLTLVIPQALLAQVHEKDLDLCPFPRPQVEASLLYSVGGMDDPGRVDETSVLAVDSQGRLLVYNTRNPGPISRFLPNGEFLDSIGGTGEGPGEFQRLRDLVVTPGDTINLFDLRLLRLTRFDSDGHLVTTVRIPGRPILQGALRLNQGWLLNGVVPTASSLGYPLHHLSEEGDLLQSFGRDIPVYRADAPWSHRRALAREGSGEVWSVRRSEYVLERFAHDGEWRLDKRLTRHVPWFEPWVRQPAPSQAEPALPFVADAAVRDDNLWVLSTVPHDSWAEHVGLSSEGRVYFRNRAEYFGSVIEVVDTARDCVVASNRFDDYFKAFAGQDLAVAFVEDQDGVPFLHVFRLRLVDAGHPDRPRP